MYKVVSKKNAVVLMASFIASSVFAANPGDKFNLKNWNITLPQDANNDGKADVIKTKKLKKFSHPDYFYLDDDNNMVFTTPNKATTTPNSSNSRSELRQMIRGKNTKIKVKAPGNNFSLKANANAKAFGEIGGYMSASLKVNHVAINAKNPDKYPAYSVVVGQIHAGKDEALIKSGEGYGWGNEPLKIYFKKWPGHEKGSVFWTYERNLVKSDPNRTDIAYPVWGNTWENKEAPGDVGVALGETFSYSVNVYENMMYLTFEAEGRSTVNYAIDLSNNVDAYGKVDAKDLATGYTGDWFYFKAGAYNQCSTKDAEGFWYAGCDGTGIWEKDFANGDYASVSFSELKLSSAKKVKQEKAKQEKSK